MTVTTAPGRGAGTAAPTTPPTTRRQDTGRRALIAVFLLPTIIGLGVFTFLPIVASFVLAFFSWDIITAPEFVGLGNFADIVTDRTIRVAFGNTLLFVGVAVVLQLAVALGLAVLVQSAMPERLRGFFRSVLFFPLVLSAASVSIIMSYLFNENFGLVNHLLGQIGVPAVPWLTSPTGAMIMVVLVYVWQNFGFSFLLFLGGLSSIPKEVYEAASVDGATGWRQFWTITFPLVSPTTLVASVMAIIAALQIFDQPYVLTRGGPGDSTRTAVMVIYETAFKQLEFGRASAIGIVLTIVIMLVTALQFRLSRRFVFYG
ncbi:carbohydrate ABC transporter permease [Serinicoccus chungangensis]|uniref:carbohydrate ABC transporter permease n=1 Tax=Serinicoccus chungangensis TaxID=767452 RepID=UPI0009F8293B|nr:sugar ABC transporter permease [Serinicoccus chungangensis]